MVLKIQILSWLFFILKRCPSLYDVLLLILYWIKCDRRNRRRMRAILQSVPSPTLLLIICVAVILSYLSPPSQNNCISSSVGSALSSATNNAGSCRSGKRPFIVVLAEPVPTFTPTGEACEEHHSARPGHRAVTPAAVAALSAAKANFWFNPTCAWRHADAILHLNPSKESSLDGLHSKARLLYAGPTTIINLHNITAQPPVDVWVVPSPKLGETLTMNTPFPYTFFPWPAGVDAERWAPLLAHSDRRKSALLYKKTDPPAAVLSSTLSALSKAGVTTISEVRYGAHSSDDYRSALQKAGVMIVFSGHETQGVFLFEAWSSDVPTFVFAGDYGDGAFQHFWENHLWLTEPAPYLSPFSGAYWSSLQQLENLFQIYDRFRPRQWILEHGTHEVIGPALVQDICTRLEMKKGAASLIS